MSENLNDGMRGDTDTGRRSRSVGRRSVLKGVLGAGSTSTIAGCFGDGDGAASPTSSPSATAGDSPTDGIEPTESPTSTASPTDVSQAGPSDNVVVVPPDGDIQGALEDVAGGGSYASTPWGTVRLQSGETYDVAETIEMPAYSVLDFNGALLTPTENVDVIDASAASHLKRPFIDAENTSGWNSTLIKVTTRVKKVESIDPVYIERMFLRAPEKQGTCVKCIDANAEGMWAVDMSGVIQKGEVGIHIRAEGDGSWVNSCFFEGIMRNQRIGVITERAEGGNASNAHEFDVVYQPSDTDWVWDCRNGEDNTMNANVWDTQYITDETFWRIGEDAGFNNKFIDNMGTYSWEDNVVENKIGGAPNGAAGNALFNWSTAQAQLELSRQVEDNASRLDDIESQLEE